MESLNLEHVLLSEAVELSLDIFILKLRVVVAAQEGVEGVVEAGQRGLMGAFGTRNLDWITGSVGAGVGGVLWRRGALLGLRALLGGTGDRKPANAGFCVGGYLKAADGGCGFGGGGWRRKGGRLAGSSTQTPLG